MTFRWAVEASGTVEAPTAFLLYLADTCDSIYTRITGTWAYPTEPSLVRNVLVEMIESAYTCVKDYATNRNVVDNYVSEQRRIRRVVVDSVSVYDETQVLPENFYTDIRVDVYLDGGNIKMKIAYKEYTARSVLTYSIDYIYTLFSEPDGLPSCQLILDDTQTMKRKIDGVFV